jgi:hypothetical protein
VFTPLRLLVHRLLQLPVGAGVPKQYEEHHRQGLSGRHRQLLVRRSASNGAVVPHDDPHVKTVSPDHPKPSPASRRSAIGTIEAL